MSQLIQNVIFQHQLRDLSDVPPELAQNRITLGPSI